VKSILSEKIGKILPKGGDIDDEATVKRWPIFRIFMAHFKPSQQSEPEEMERKLKFGRERKPDFGNHRDGRRGEMRREEIGRRDMGRDEMRRMERRPVFSRDDDFRRPNHRMVQDDFRMHDDHHEEFGHSLEHGDMERPWDHHSREHGPHKMGHKMMMPRMLSAFDGKHLNNVSPKNKFTLLQVFVNKKPEPQSFPMKSLHHQPPNMHPFMPQHPVHLHQLTSNTIPPYHPEIAPNQFINYHPFYPHMKPTISNRPPWRSIPFRNPSPNHEEQQVFVTTESAEEPQPSYACLLPLDAGMCKTYQVY
jgi:hypothetical protein